MGLNKQQQLAVDTIHGPLLIIAGAGSGKTTVLTHRIAHMVQSNIQPWNILAVTFTNKAAAEMRERISESIGKKQARDLWMMTFHSMCARILRNEGNALSFLGGKMSSNFTIYDPADTKGLLKKIIQQMGHDIKQVTPQGMGYYISMLKNEMIDVESFKTLTPSNPHIDWDKATEIIQNKIPPDKQLLIAQVYEEYQKALANNNGVDFDDMILHTIRLFMEREDILAKYQEKFKYVMVDEFQDTNNCQYVLIKMLAGKYRNLAVVGDDAQSIYAFRGADIRNILSFEEDYPETNVIKLEENYRCGPYILQAANEVIANNTMQRQKSLFTQKQQGEKIGYYRAYDERDEARYAVNEIQQLIRSGRKYKDISILFRANNQSRSYEEAFMRAGFPYQLVGMVKFFERMEVKDIISYLQFIQNPNDTISFSRIINTPKRGLGKKTVENIISAGYGKDFLSFLKNPEGVKVSKAAKEGLSIFVELIELYQEKKETTPIGELLSEFIMDSGYINMLKMSKDEKANERIQNIAELVNIAVEMQNENSDATLLDFLEHASLHSAQDDQTDDNAIRLMTLHAAKGLEFPVVFLAGMEEGIFPHKKAEEGFDIEEERRLCYVGITRAKEKLFMTNARSRRTWGQEEENPPSRFLFEFNEELVDARYPIQRAYF